MNCQDAQELLVAYLDGEVAPSERALLNIHLAGCETCREERDLLQATQTQVRRFLQIRAAQAAPSPQAWSRLQARLAEACPERRRKARPSPSWLPTWLQRQAPGVGHPPIFTGGMTMKNFTKGLVWATIAAIAIALSVMVLVPSVRAQVSELFRWFRFESPGGGGEVSIPGSVEFTPLRPAYLPAGFQAMAVGLNPEAASLNYWNSTTGQILLIDQLRLSPDDNRSLPSGQRVTINGRPAGLITGLEGNVTFVFLSPTPAAPITPPDDSALEPITASGETVSYRDGNQLVWYVGDIRVEMVSNLPVEEMVKIAESMIPAEEGAIGSDS